MNRRFESHMLGLRNKARPHDCSVGFKAQVKPGRIGFSANET